MKYVDIRGLPPCALSPQCLRLLDELDVLPMARAPARLSYIDDLQDERQLRQIRAHVSGCSTCSSLLAEARHLRTQQRTMLHHFLIANEQRVPATTQTIFVALRHEQAQQEKEHTRTKRAYTRARASSDSQQYANAPLALPLALHTRTTQQRSLLQHMLTLVTVVAVILAAVGLLNRVANPSTASTSAPPHPQHPESGANNEGWNSVIIGLTLISVTSLIKSMTVYDFNTTNGQLSTLLTSQPDISDMHLEEISKDGQNLLYDAISPDQHMTTYTTFSASSGSHAFYHLSTRFAGNALWMDADHVLTQNMQGIVSELNVQSGVTQHAWSLNATRLTFYHAPFLYFTATEKGVAHALYRLDLTQSGAVPQQVTAPLSNTRFWLSPTGDTIFYTRNGQSGEQGIYAVSSDGTNEHLLYSGSGIPIGYAEDNTLMVLQQVGTQVQVIKLGATAQGKEHIVFANAAPQATSLCEPASVVPIIALCDQNIVLAPYGHGLLLHAYYANGSHGLVYDDLTNGTSRKILPMSGDTTVQLPGWSRMPSAA